MICYGDIMDKDSPFLGFRYGKIEEFLDNNNSYRVGLNDGFVKANVDKPFLYTSDIKTCIVILLVMEDEAWMAHLEGNLDIINNVIDSFNINVKDISKVYIFPGIMTDVLVINDIVNKFNNNVSVVSPYYDSSYGYSNAVGGIGYKFVNNDLCLFGIDSSGYVCEYRINCLSLSDIDSFFDCNINNFSNIHNKRTFV